MDDNIWNIEKDEIKEIELTEEEKNIAKKYSDIETDLKLTITNINKTPTNEDK